MMKLSVSNSSGLPLYQQLYDQIAGGVIRGELKSGTPLPPIRTVATELRISVISIKRAWEELERDGFIVTAVGRGCFVRELSAQDISYLRGMMIQERIKSDVAYAKSLGVSLEEFSGIVKHLF